MIRVLSNFLRRIRGASNRIANERDLDDEMRFHIDMEAADLARSGLAPDEARRQAHAAFGGTERAKEEWRDGRLTAFIERLTRDLRFSLRRLRRQPAFTVPVVLTLAIGLASVASIFTITDSVILRPLPYPHAEQLVLIGHLSADARLTDGGQSEAGHFHYLAGNHVFSGMAVYVDRELSLTGGAAPERVLSALSSPSLFTVLGVKPALGRTCTDADVAMPRPAKDAHSTIIISHELWARRYGGDPAIIGRIVDEINRAPTMILGVMPKGFHFPRAETQLWYCMPMDHASPASGLYMTGIARLKPGMHIREANSDLRRLDETLRERLPEAAAELAKPGVPPAAVIPLKDAMVRDVRGALVFLSIAAVFVLVVASANVANLFLARAERDHHLAAIERALGATSGDLARRMIGESTIVSITGGALALLAAAIIVTARFGISPSVLPRAEEVRVGGAVVVLTIGLALASGLLVGIVSFARTSRGVASSLLGALGTRTTGGREWRSVQRALMVVQIAFALALVVGSVGMLESYRQLARFDLGFDPKHALVANIELPFANYRRYDDGARFFGEVLTRIRALPGVVSAEGAGAALPLTPLEAFGFNPVRALGDGTRAAGDPVKAPIGLVTPNWFASMRIPIVRGRTFQRGDLLGPVHPVVVSSALAHLLFGDADAIGKRVTVSNDKAAYTVVGVVGNVPGETIPAGPAKTLYFPVLDDLRETPDVRPVTLYYPGSLSLFVRGSIEPAALVPAIRRIVRDVDTQVPVAHIRMLEEVVADSMARARLTMLLLAIGAGTALVLGMIGVYGVMSYAVSLRTREFGVRMALGATPGGVRGMLLRQSARVVAAGVCCGIGAAIGVTQLLRGLLFQVRPGEPSIFIVASSLVLVVAFVATWIPARRAGRVDPTTALRAE